MNIYLCGPINACTDDESITWREWMKKHGAHLGYWLDPMKRDYRGREQCEYREIVDLDKRDIRSCDLIVVMYTKPSVGTSMEVFFAWTLGVPAIVIDKTETPLSPWLRYHATSIVKTEVEALRKIREWQ